MLPYQLAFAGLALPLACPLPSPIPFFAVFSPDLPSDFLGSPFVATNFLMLFFSLVGVAVACAFFFSGVALGFGEAFFLGVGLAVGFGDGFGRAVGDGVGCGVAAGISISLFVGAGGGCVSSGG